MVLPTSSRLREVPLTYIYIYSQIILTNIHVSLKVLQATVDCSLLLKDCSFNGLSHSGLNKSHKYPWFHSVDCCLSQGFVGPSGLLSPAQGLRFLCGLSHSGFSVGMSCIYVSRFTCIHTKTMRGTLRDLWRVFHVGLNLKYVGRHVNHFEKSHSFSNMHAEVRQLELDIKMYHWKWLQ